MSGFSNIDRAIADIAAGKAVIVVDDADRENEGDLIFAAEMATPELVAFMVRYTSGYICVPLTEDDCDRLELPPMYHTNQDKRGTAYTVSVDAREGVTTGISAHDRATTMRLLAADESTAADFTRPGHVVPLRAKAGGVLRRPKPPSICAGLPVCVQPVCSARSSARKTSRTWPDSTSSKCLPPSTTLRSSRSPT
jgi:3,4-dihydroxy 2-butanone 4-phosphate synthase/GTP cyclohydrolase II